MPSLMRFLSGLAVAAGLCFAAVYALATFVEPRKREMTVVIPAEKLRPPPTATAAPRNARTAGAEAPVESAPATR